MVTPLAALRSLLLTMALSTLATTAATMAAAAITNEMLLLDFMQNNPGEGLGWQQSAFMDPSTVANLGFSGVSSTGENSGTLGLEWRGVLAGRHLYPAGSPERAWTDRMREGAVRWVNEVKRKNMMAFFFVDLIVFPKALIAAFRDEIVDPTTNKIVLNAATKRLLTAMLDELFATYPAADGIIVRTGEIYVYDLPYHQGNSPTDGVPAAQQNDVLVDFVSFLRAAVCERHGRRVLYRTWDSFGGWDAPPQLYLNVTDRVEPSPLFYFSIKHVSGDFFRTMDFNRQLGIGRHAQVVEVECQREYEGKGAFPNYVMNAVLEGDWSAPTRRQGLADLMRAPSSRGVVRGVWTWSRGGGWWGPHVKGRDVWNRLHVAVVAHWWLAQQRGGGTGSGVATEEDSFQAVCLADDRLSVLGKEGCGHFRQLALLSGNATVAMHYCPEGDEAACWGWTRDDRLGGRHQLDSHMAFLQKQQLFNASIAHKKTAVKLFDQMAAIFAKRLEEPLSRGVSRDFAHQLAVSVEYGQRLAGVIEAAWRVMCHGYQVQHPSSPTAAAGGTAGGSGELSAAIADYDARFAAYRAFGLIEQSAASLYRDVYFNLPSQQPADGIGETVEYYRNLTMITLPDL